MTIGLFIIDFDLTITQDHTHNVLANAIWRGLIDKDDTEEQWKQIKHIKPTGSAEKWRDFFKQVIASGHKVAVASFSAYPAIVKRYLQDAIGLDENTLKQIFIESWLPDDPRIADKNIHIANIIKHFQYTESPEFIVLVDDSIQNCKAALLHDYSAIEVISGDETGAHIDEALALSEKFKAL